MEEDISLSCYCSPHNYPAFHGSSIIHQDLLSRRANKDPTTSELSSAGTATFFSTPLPSPPPFPPAMATSLSSKSGQRETGVDSTPFFMSSLNFPFDGLASSASLLSSFCKKRNSEHNDDRPGDRRHKRKMKNRESAARSRARRQAYALELERERAYWMEENARLRKGLQEELCFAAAAATEVPKKAQSV
ncbi:hypothetical protein Nepgr_029183 [Nepenthes gracilis]|uniref:BZIP domain-containing protein n=1 Tax=Nepenthes gracilis TaxID=150966 RepID=A0AAD3TD54_NEPGR|nr:hypothetical protein Nepgr_029183 [Nepenthes gracilis]